MEKSIYPEKFTLPDLVFPSEIGTPLNPPNLTRHFKRILKKADLRTSIRIYDLRHSMATLLLQGGVNPKVVSERLGHATIILTLDVGLLQSQQLFLVSEGD